ncbi:DgyrCDS6795 [Dimorphilus gyrociliatus]|uniref:DgyrCDS6795 n=1 Tax=Dimorphilus gyrociliatus TaxID=2664684 RepID=A0A7I8VQN6_9ANNE|nr:DgyrCDS6795 [Dimorphilus gyrociliatus]
MPLVLRFEDQVFYYILRNFRSLMKNLSFLRLIKNKTIPPSMCDRIFNGLNIFYAGIPGDFLEMFTVDKIQLTHIRFGDQNIKNKNFMKFLIDQKLQNLTIEPQKIMAVEELLGLIDSEHLEQFAAHYCEFLPMNKLCKENRKRQLKHTRKKSFVFSWPFPPLRNLTVLNVSESPVDNLQFFFITKESQHLVDVNISATSITDLRLLKKQTKLQYLDCSGMNSSIEKSYIYLHCLKNLKCLTFGQYFPNKSKFRLTWLKEVNPVIQKYLTVEELEAYREVPQQFKTKRSWNISQFLRLAHWKDITFFELIGKWNPSPSSVSEFINNHPKLEFISLSKNFPECLNTSLKVKKKKMKDIFNIHNYEKVYGRNDMSFRIIHDDDSFPIDRLNIDDIDIMYHSIDFHDEIVLPKVNEYKKNFPRERREEFCQYLAKELTFEKFSFSGIENLLSDECLLIYCLDIEKSDHFLTIITLIAEKFLQAYSYISSPLGYIFFEVLTKYHQYFKMTTNISLVYRKLFEDPDLYFYDFAYQDLMRCLIKFIDHLDLDKMSGKDLAGLCRGIRDIKKWSRTELFNDFIPKLHDTLQKVIKHCKNKFGWDMTKVEKSIDYITAYCTSGAIPEHDDEMTDDDDDDDEAILNTTMCTTDSDDWDVIETN